MKKNYYILFIFFAISCKPKLDKDIELFHNGDADFSSIIYIGDNLLSGYQDGGLYQTAQENSLASILSTQFEQVGGNTISQPLMNPGSGTNHLQIDSYSSEGFTTIWNTVNTSITGTNSIINTTCSYDSILNQFSSFNSSITNFSTPEMRVSDINSTTIGVVSGGEYNPYFERISNNSTYFELIDNTSPTFFVSAFGLSDVLAKAKQGWTCNSSTQGDVFENNYNSLLKLLTEKSSNGVLIDVPNIENLPFLNTKYEQTDSIFIQAKQGYTDAIEVRALDTLNDVILREYINLIGVDGYGTSSNNPIIDKHIIDRFEKDQLASDIDKYNLIIRKLASKHKLAHVDMENYLHPESGDQNDKILLNGVNTTIKYEEGSGVSLDGIFPTPRGAASIANKCIDAINSKYNAYIPLVDINNYQGLMLP